MNVKETYQCATSWLEDCWDENLVSPSSARRLESKSLHALALYAVSKGLNAGVYKKLMLAHTPSKRPSSGTVDIHVRESASNNPIGRANHEEIIQPRRYQTDILQNTAVFTHSRPVLDYGTVNVPRRDRTYQPYRRGISDERRSDPVLPSWGKILGGLFVFLLICGLIFGFVVAYVAWIGTRWLFASSKETVYSVRENIVRWILALWKAISDEFEKEFPNITCTIREKLTAWIPR